MDWELRVRIEGFAGDDSPTSRPASLRARSCRWEINPQQPRLELEKSLDPTSSTLYRACATGRTFPQIAIQYLASGQSVPLFRIDLDDAVITSITQSVAGANPADLTERLTFRYSRITWTYSVFPPDGTPQGVSSTSALAAERPVPAP